MFPQALTPVAGKQSPHLTHHVSERQANPCSDSGSISASRVIGHWLRDSRDFVVSGIGRSRSN